jgi:hypothetical protein
MVDLELSRSCACHRKAHLGPMSNWEALILRAGDVVQISNKQGWLREATDTLA